MVAIWPRWSRSQSLTLLAFVARILQEYSIYYYQFSDSDTTQFLIFCTLFTSEIGWFGSKCCGGIAYSEGSMSVHETTYYRRGAEMRKSRKRVVCLDETHDTTRFLLVFQTGSPLQRSSWNHHNKPSKSSQKSCSAAITASASWRKTGAREWMLIRI